MRGRRPSGAGLGAAKYSLSQAPDTVSLTAMAGVGCLRWTGEDPFERAQGAAGLEHEAVSK